MNPRTDLKHELLNIALVNVLVIPVTIVVFVARMLVV